MKVKVKQRFRDKYTGDILFAGEILIVSEERYHEIEAKDKNLVEIMGEKEELKETSETVESEEETTGKENLESAETPDDQEETLDELSRVALEKMKVDELRKKAEEMGVDSMGKKEELIKRILGKEENVDEES
nr:MAG TPA_asm: SAP domain [Caudoviricetes sp.]